MSITIRGAARNEEVTGWEGQSRYRLDFELDPGGPALIDESHTLFMAHGGYLIAVEDEQAAILGSPQRVLPRTRVSKTWENDVPLSLVALQTATRDESSVSILNRELRQFAVTADSGTRWAAGENEPEGYLDYGPSRIPPGDVEHGFLIGLMGQVDVIDIVEPKDNVNVVRRRLILTGHFLNVLQDPDIAEFFAHPRKDVHWRAVVREHATSRDVVDEMLSVRSDWPGFGENALFGSTGRFAVFHYALRLPNDFTFGRLSLEFRLGAIAASYETEIAVADVDVLHLPLDPIDRLLQNATINFGNGPAQFGEDPNVRTQTHNGNVKERYAFDLGVYVDGSATKPGAPASALDSFWSFGQPIYSMAEGTVIRVETGLADSLPGTGPEPNRITIRHDRAGKPRYSVYAHVKMNSEAVRVGDHVDAGQKIAEMGCNGPSDAPHCHAAYYQFDDWGSLRMLPMAFTVSDGGGGTVTGVPQGGQQFEAPAGTGAGSNRSLWDQVADAVVDFVVAVVSAATNQFGRH